MDKYSVGIEASPEQIDKLLKEYMLQNSRMLVFNKSFEEQMKEMRESFILWQIDSGILTKKDGKYYWLTSIEKGETIWKD